MNTQSQTPNTQTKSDKPMETIDTNANSQDDEKPIATDLPADIETSNIS